MSRFRWFERESDDPSSPLHWPDAAKVLATLFLNLWAWLGFGTILWQFCPLPRYTLLLAGLSLLAVGLFYMGPMLLAHRLRRPLFGVIEDCLGWIPMLALRVCATIFLVLWIGGCAWMLATFAIKTNGGVVAAALLLLIFWTGTQSLRMHAKLASFSLQLAIAILIAALLRVQVGWYAIPEGFELTADRSGVTEAWIGFSWLAWYVMPVGIFAAEFGYRCRNRRDVAFLGLTGVAVPLFVSLLAAGVIGTAVGHSDLYQPSLAPSVGMALWSHAASSAVAPRVIIAAVTAFGAMRFGVRALAESASRFMPIAAVAVLATALMPAFSFEAAFGFTIRCMAVTSAVLTGDYLVRRRSAGVRRRFHWGGCLALLVGMATPLYFPGSYPRGIQSYLVALIACVAIRGGQRIWTSGAARLRSS
jgi:hypothetical protein